MLNKPLPSALLILSATLVYATIRYIVFGTVAINQLPTFIVNKAISFSAAWFLFLSAYSQWRGSDHSSAYGRYAWHCLLLHIVLSFAVLSPAYFQKFYEGALLNMAGELLILFGALGSYCFYRLREARHNTALKALSSALLLAHLLPMWGSWLSPQTWLGSLPPISLLSALFSFAALSFFLLCQSRVNSST